MSARPAPLADQVTILRRAALAIPAPALVPAAIHALILACLVRLLDRLAEMIRAWQEGQLPPPPRRARTAKTPAPRPGATHPAPPPHAPGARAQYRDSAARPGAEAAPRTIACPRPTARHMRRIPARTQATASAAPRTRAHRFARSPPGAVQKRRATPLPLHAIFVTISKL